MKKTIQTYIAVILCFLLLCSNFEFINSYSVQANSESLNLQLDDRFTVNDEDLLVSWEEAIKLPGDPAIDQPVIENAITESLFYEIGAIQPAFQGTEDEIAIQQKQYERFRNLDTGEDLDQLGEARLEIEQEKLNFARTYAKQASEHMEAYSKITLEDLINQFDVEKEWVEEKLENGLTLPQVFTMLWEQDPANALQNKNVDKTMVLLDEQQNEQEQPLTFDGIDLRVEYEKPAKTPTEHGKSASIQNTNPTEHIEIPTLKNDTAPYQVGLYHENISLLSGGISLDEGEFTLPGRNGLSFTLQRTYDSNDAQKNAMDLEISSTYGYTFDYWVYFFTRDIKYTVDHVYNVTVDKYLCVNNVKTGGVVWSGPKENVTITSGIYSSMYGVDLAKANPPPKANEMAHACGTYGNPNNYYYELRYTPTTISSHREHVPETYTLQTSYQTNDAPYATSSAAQTEIFRMYDGYRNKNGRGGTYEGGYYDYSLINNNPGSIYPVLTSQTAYNKVKDDPFDKKFPIGKGWRWNVPYMKFENNKKYVSIGQGIYEVSGSSLVNYPWSDLSFQNNTSVSYEGRQSQYAISSVYGMKYYFDSLGNILQIEDGYQDNTIRFGYTNHATYGLVLTSIEDALQNKLTIAYTGLQVVISYNGKTITYDKEVQEGKEVLKEVTDPNGRTTAYQYEYKPAVFSLSGSGSMSNPYYLLSEVTHPTGVKSKYTYETNPVNRWIGSGQYNQQYRLMKREDVVLDDVLQIPNSYNVSTLVYTGDMASSHNQNYNFSTTLFNGLLETKMSYKKQYINSNIGSMYYNTQSRVSDGTITKVTDMTYDEAKRRTNPTGISTFYRNEATSTTTVPVTSTTTYDDYQNVLTVKNPHNLTSTYTYHSGTKRLAFSVEPVTASQSLYTEVVSRNPQGDITEVKVREGSPTGTILQHTQYEYDSYGNQTLVRSLDPDMNRETQIEYSDLYNYGFPTKVTRPYTQLVAPTFTQATGITKTQVVEATYDRSTGNVLTVKDGNQHMTTFTYDELGRMVTTKHPDNSMVSLDIDDANNEATQTDELGRKSYVKWNALGWQVESGIYVENPQAQAGEDPIKKGNKTIQEYDPFGRVIASRDPNFVHQTMTYDNWGRVLTTSVAASLMQTMVYDDLSFMVTSKHSEEEIRETSDYLGRVIRKEEKKGNTYETKWQGAYDQANRLIQQWDGKGNRTELNYNALGQLSSVRGADNNVYTYRYDRQGQLVETIYPDQAISKKKYDQLGQLIQAIDPLSKSEFYQYDGNGNRIALYDKKGQLFTYTYSDRNFLLSKTSPTDVIEYAYHDDGTRASMTDNDNQVTSYAYDPYTGELKTVTFPDQKSLTYAYDAAGLRISIDTPFQGTVDYAYNGKNQLEKLSWNQGIVANYEYNAKGQWNKTTLGNGILTQMEYSYAKLNEMTHTLNQAELFQFTYAYDQSNNITLRGQSINGQLFQDQFTYDNMNRIKTSSLFNDYYNYDSRGNRQVLQSDSTMDLSKNVQYEYDEWDRLVKVTTVDTKEVEYRYNGDNLLIERIENGVTTRYYYDGQDIIAEGIVQSNGDVIQKKSYIRGNGLAMQEGTNGAKAYYVHNGHGDVVGLYGQNGEELNTYTYDIWGNTIDQTVNANGGVDNLFRYSGEYWDETTGLQYLRARWYDPSLGRFINEDTYEGELTNPLSQNRYTYVHNNPLIYADPTGNYCVSADGKWAHDGECDSISSIYLGDDSAYVNRPIIENGKVTGYINSSNMPYGSMNYWENYFEDKVVFLERKPGFTIDLYYGNARSIPIYDDPLLLFQGALPKNAVKGLGKAIVKQGVKEGAKAVISKEIAALSANNINHILKSKHLWSKVVKDPDNWDQVAAVMTTVMAKGAQGSYKNVFMKSMYVNNELVVVTYNKLADGTIKIGNAWVTK